MNISHQLGAVGIQQCIQFGAPYIRHHLYLIYTLHYTYIGASIVQVLPLTQYWEVYCQVALPLQ